MPYYVRYHLVDNLAGVRVDGEFFEDQGIYTVRGKPRLYEPREIEGLPEGEYRPATDAELEAGRIGGTSSYAGVVLVYDDGSEYAL